VSETLERSRIADPSLADAGEERIAWVARHSPVLNRLARERLGDGSFQGRRVAVVVHLEAKTAYLATLFADAGARVVAAASNAMTTNDAVCAALVRRGIEVHAVRGATVDEFEGDLLGAADFGPEIVVDDGAELTTRIIRHRPDLAAKLRGMSEETTTGVMRLRALERDGKLTFPAVAANDAWSKHLYDNRYGTGQSTIAAILRLTNLSGAGKRFCVIGYGWVGKGLARYAEGVGGKVTVVEIDPVPALEAHLDGHRVAPIEEALPDADVVITGTGTVEAVGAEHLAYLKDGALLANAGHHDREIDVAALGPGEEVRAGVTRHYVGSGKPVYLLAGGHLVNISGADGHPVEIMDLSFSVQALSAHLIASQQLQPGLQTLPEELDREIARTKLATLGIELGAETEAQRSFREDWTQ
jgi:adenosylhomocysteinase